MTGTTIPSANGSPAIPNRSSSSSSLSSSSSSSASSLASPSSRLPVPSFLRRSLMNLAAAARGQSAIGGGGGMQDEAAQEVEPATTHQPQTTAVPTAATATTTTATRLPLQHQLPGNRSAGTDDRVNTPAALPSYDDSAKIDTNHSISPATTNRPLSASPQSPTSDADPAAGGGVSSLLPVPKRARARPGSAGSADMVVVNDDLIPTPPESPTFSRDGGVTGAAAAAATAAATASPSPASQQKLKVELRETTLAAQQYRSQIDALHAALEEKDSRIAKLTNTVGELKEVNSGAEEYIAGLESQVERHAEIASTVERLEAELAMERRGGGAADGASTQQQQQQQSKTAQSDDAVDDPHVAETKLAISNLWAQLMEQESKTAELADDDVSEQDRVSFARKIRAQIDELQKQLPEGTTTTSSAAPSFVPHVVVPATDDVILLQQTVAKLKSELAEKTSDHQALAQAYDALHAEVEHYSAEIRILRDGLVDHHGRTTEEDSRVAATLVDANAELERLVHGLEKRIAELAEANATLASESEIAEARFGREVDERVKENEVLVRKLEEVKSAHEAAVREKEEAVARQQEEHLRMHDDVVRDLTASRDAHAAERDTLVARVAELESARATLAAEKAALAAQHDEHLRAHDDVVRDLTNSRDAHAAERDTLATRVTELETADAALSAEKAALAAKHEEHLRTHGDVVRDLANSRDAHAAERDTLVTRITDLEAARDAAQAKHDALTVTHDSHLAEKEALVAQLVAMEASHAALVSERDALAVDHDGAKARLVVYEVAARDLASERDGHAAEKESLAARLADVEAAHAALVAERDALKADNVGLKNIVSKHEESTRELAGTQGEQAREAEAARSQLAQLEAKHAALVAEKEALVAEKEALAQEHAAHLQTHDNVVRDLAAQVDTHAAERETLTTKLSELARDHSAAAAEKANIVAELAALKTQHESVRQVDDNDDVVGGVHKAEREALELQLAALHEKAAQRDAELAAFSEREASLSAEKNAVSAQHEQALGNLRAQLETHQADRKRQEEAHAALVGEHAVKLAEVEGELQAFKDTVVPELERRVAVAVEDRDAVRNELSARTSEAEQLAAEVNALRAQVDKAHAAQAELEAILASIKNDHAAAHALWSETELKLRADVEAAIAESAALQATHASRVAELEEQHLAARRAHEISESGARDLASLHTDLAAQLVARTEAEAVLRVELEAAKRRVEELEAAIHDYEAESKARIVELESQCEALRAENAERRQQAIDAQSSSARDVVEPSDREVDGVVNAALLSAELDLLREAARKRDEELAAVHADLAQARLRVQELKVEVDRVRELEGLHETTTARMAELDSHHQTAQTKIAELEAALAAAAAAHAAAEAHAQKPTATNVETSTENGDVVNMYREQISEVCNDRNAIQAEIEQLKGVMATMATAEQVMEFKKTGAEKEALQTETVALRATLEELNGKVATLSQSEANLAAELHAARNDAAAKHQETEARLLAKVQHLEAVALDLRDQLAVAAEARSSRGSVGPQPQLQQPAPWQRDRSALSMQATKAQAAPQQQQQQHQQYDSHDFEDAMSVHSSRKRSMDSLDSAAVGHRPFSFVESIRARPTAVYNHSGLALVPQSTSRSPRSIIHSARAIADASFSKSGAPETASLAERERQELLHMIEILSAHISTADQQLNEDHGRVAQLQRELNAARAEIGTASQQSEQRAAKLQERVDKQLDEIANMEYELVKARSNENAAVMRVKELEEQMMKKVKEAEQVARSSTAATTNGKSGTSTARSSRAARRGDAAFTPLELKEVMPALLFEEYSTRRGSNEKRSSKTTFADASASASPAAPGDRAISSLPPRRSSARPPPRQSVTPSDSDIDRWRTTSALHVTNNVSTSTLTPVAEEGGGATAAPIPTANGGTQTPQEQQAVIGELGMELSASRRRVRDLENAVADLERLQADSKSSVRVLVERIRVLEEEEGGGGGHANGNNRPPPPPTLQQDGPLPPLPPQAVFTAAAAAPPAAEQSGGREGGRISSRGLFSRSRNSARSKSRDPAQQPQTRDRQQQTPPPRDGPVFPPPPASPPPRPWRNLSDLDLPSSGRMMMSAQQQQQQQQQQQHQQHQQQQQSDGQPGGQPRQSISETALSRSKSSAAGGAFGDSSSPSADSAMKKKRSFWWSKKSS
ncbi:hypothetical protein HDU87_001813 [Geranomyces variabilis]|uniref:Uncharacterized protein n=1 Tax=Geranomyces variabilis TaxID=109894 RepID=A0AAD5TNV8_9FUNG|nr:hypothetical protein HDU87_001813 [Geranomyces variabilis]